MKNKKNHPVDDLMTADWLTRLRGLNHSVESHVDEQVRLIQFLALVIPEIHITISGLQDIDQNYSSCNKFIACSKN